MEKKKNGETAYLFLFDLVVFLINVQLYFTFLKQFKISLTNLPAR